MDRLYFCLVKNMQIETMDYIELVFIENVFRTGRQRPLHGYGKEKDHDTQVVDSE